MQKEILKFCLEKGFLVDNDLLDLFSETSDIESIKLIIEKAKTYTPHNVLTKNFFEKNKKEFGKLFSGLPKKNQKGLERLRIKLGLSIEISKENFSPDDKDKIKTENSTFNSNVKVLTTTIQQNKKIEVKDFVSHFKGRFNQMKNILQERSELTNLVSIDKISGNRQGISIIGIIYSRNVTKNKNIILEVEDMTGKIKLLINKSKENLYKIAEEISLDSVLGFKCSGNNEILFVNEIVFPDAVVSERKFSPTSESALFIGDLHYGSNRFLKKGFLKFIDYLNGRLSKNLHEKAEVEKIKYLFITGDLVTGVGNYPGQEADLEISDLEKQFIDLSEFLKMIPKHIKIIISPGNHDGVRIMEPQPIFDERYAWPLFQLENVIITENPCMVNIGEANNFRGFDVLTYHGFSYPYYANIIPDLIMKKAMNCPEEIMKYLLKNRHLAPTHGSTQYYPHKDDKLIIKNVPDIFVSSHTHKCGVSYHNNILIISTSCWEAMTPYQEKFGNEPDHCKVPMINLKTRAVKILDFEDIENEY